MNSSLLFRLSVFIAMAPLLGSAQGFAETAVPRSASIEDQAGAVITDVIEAWRRADAKSISAQYELDGDFVSPTGEHASGRQMIETFYRTAFEAGYAQSDATGTVLHVRGLSPDYALIDGLWMIVPTKSSKITQSESGLFVAILHRHNGRWWIVALREQSSAQRMRELGPNI